MKGSKYSKEFKGLSDLLTFKAAFDNNNAIVKKYNNAKESERDDKEKEMAEKELKNARSVVVFRRLIEVYKEVHLQALDALKGEGWSGHVSIRGGDRRSLTSKAASMGLNIDQKSRKYLKKHRHETEDVSD